MNEVATSARGRESARIQNRERRVEEHADYLYAFALLRLRDATRAQDAVQEAFLAALQNEGSCRDPSAERAWLTGILKHKIYDHFRKMSREISFTDLEFYLEEENRQFVEEGWHKGSWADEGTPAHWPNPGENLDREAFWAAFNHCAAKLPSNIGRVFLLRELDGMETKEICSLLGVTENNIWVMLHRARMALRRCLEKNWFAGAK